MEEMTYTFEIKGDDGQLFNQRERRNIPPLEAAREYILMQPKKGERFFILPTIILGSSRTGRKGKLFATFYRQSSILRGLTDTETRGRVFRLRGATVKLGILQQDKQVQQLRDPLLHLPIIKAPSYSSIGEYEKALFSGQAKMWEYLVYQAVLERMPKTWWVGNRTVIDTMPNGEEILNLLQDGDIVTKTTVPIEQWNSIFG